MQSTKQSLRKEILARRKASDAPVLTLDRLSGITEYKNAKVVFCYISAHGEAGTRELLWQIAGEKTLLVPFCTDDMGNMICVEIRSEADLKDGRFNIPEPINPIPYDKRKIDAAIVPGIAFDRDGYRLGYGKGYYDRFLADISPYKIGVCKKEFLLEEIPHNQYDVKMDEVIAL